MKKRNRPEDDLQRAVCELLMIYERQGKLRFFSVPNGGKRSKIEASIMKGLGVRAGVPDLCILIPKALVFWERPNSPPGNGWSSPRTVFFELKAPKGALSGKQLEWFDGLNADGFSTYVIRTLDDVELALAANGIVGVTLGRVA